MRSAIVFLFISACAKSSEPLEKTYTPPDIDWNEEIDFENLPEAEDTGEHEGSGE